MYVCNIYNVWPFPDITTNQRARNSQKADLEVFQTYSRTLELT